MPTREEVARAIQEADDNFGYSIRLVSLVDGVSTYTVECAGETVEVESHSDGLEIVTAHLNKARADAVLALMQPDEAMVEALQPFADAADNMTGDEHDWASLWEQPEAMLLTYGDLRRARACLTAAMNREQKP